MDEASFRTFVVEVWTAMPERFRARVTNVAVLVEDEPSDEVRREEGLSPEETLLGFYRGIPNTERGSDYGVGGTLPDTITLYRLPLLEEAGTLLGSGRATDFRSAVQLAVQETLWHEVGHYFGLDEKGIGRRETEGTNNFRPE